MKKLYEKFFTEQIIDSSGMATHQEMFEALLDWFEDKRGKDVSYIVVGSATRKPTWLDRLFTFVWRLFDREMTPFIPLDDSRYRDLDFFSPQNRAYARIADNNPDLLVIVKIDPDGSDWEGERFSFGYDKYDREFAKENNRNDWVIYNPADDSWLFTILEMGQVRTKIKICLKK